MPLLTLRRKTRGFTLIELTIVLLVAGILFAGLWRLIAGGNQQLAASSAATQQLQIINAAKTFFAGFLWAKLYGGHGSECSRHAVAADCSAGRRG